MALQESLKDHATDKRDVLARFVPHWANPSTREMATDSLIAKGPAFVALPLARRLRRDSVVVAVMDRVAGDPEQIEARNTWAMYAILGPRLREDPRLQPAFRRLGFPDVTRPGSAREQR